MSSQRRMIAAVDSFVSQRQGGARSKKHIRPLLDFAAAELRSRGVRDACIRFEIPAGRFYRRDLDLAVDLDGAISLCLFLVTQSGSVRKNLNNRRREIVGDAVNLRTAYPDASVGVVYLLRADDEAKRKGASGTSPIDELAEFLHDLQTATVPLGRPLLDAAALIAANRNPDGRIRIERIPPEVDVLRGFFDKLTAGLGKDVRVRTQTP